MNPTDMSGDDLCEQPILQPAELRALVGLAGMALVLLVGIRAVSPLSTTNALPAAAAAPVQSPTHIIDPHEDAPLEWVPITTSIEEDVEATTTTETVLPVVTDIN
ncbi:MAG: hypothetical protein KBE09_00450 [Candidatus Pacebacteria bacterium]|nr:hypothetical protein [Candidatus Paceibacterota bacterium]